MAGTTSGVPTPTPGSRGVLVAQVPNLLSLLRLACAVALPLSPRTWWLPLVLVAGLSDWIDGQLARRLGVTSWIGGLLDGVSDKAFVITALVTLAHHDLIPEWWIPLLLLRDLAVAVGCTITALRGNRQAFREMASRVPGKLTTVLVFALLVTRLAWPQATALHAGLFWSTAALSATAALDYSLTRSRQAFGHGADRG